MDRISALRNVEAALREFEEGEIDLATTQDRVRSVLQTYATEFEGVERRPFRVAGDGDDRVVVAPDPETAAERVAADLDGDPELDVEPLTGAEEP